MLGNNSGSAPLAVLHDLGDGEAVDDPLEVSPIVRGGKRDFAKHFKSPS